MGWKNLIDEGWKPPYLACIKCNGSFSGSGLLVGPRHVLTALHVLGVLSDPSWEPVSRGTTVLPRWVSLCLPHRRVFGWRFRSRPRRHGSTSVDASTSIGSTTLP